MKDNQKKNRKSFAVKAGCTAGLAAVFGFVASGVFISTTTLATNVQNAKIQTAVVAEAENASDQNGIVTTDVNIGSTAEANEATEQETGKALTVQEVAANVMPAMVAITSTTVEEVNDYFGGFGGYGFFGGFGQGGSDTIESVGAGSGEIIGETDDQLIIATNQHVIADSTTLSVAFVDESAAPAYVLGEDASTDLAVIAVNKSDLSESTLQAIRVVAIGSSDDLVVGESVVAIGNALGYGQSVSAGIVSAKNRVLADENGNTEGTDEGLIQTDAAINPGNSGGALLNMKGELIGINSAKYADTDVEGMGYAIPISDALPILQSLQNGESVSGSDSATGTVRLGIKCATVTASNAGYYNLPQGVYVSEVENSTAAYNGGVKAGDIITAIGDIPVSTVEELSQALTGYSEGDSAVLKIMREQSGTYAEGELTVTFGNGLNM